MVVLHSITKSVFSVNTAPTLSLTKSGIFFKCDEEHLKKIPDLVKERVGAVKTENTDLVMQCITTITSTSTTLKNLYIGTQYHSLYSTNTYSDQTDKMDRLSLRKNN